MQIKKAAELSGLTERAVRLYEERGLITPEHINKNGRDFREYSDADVEKLKTIASLRRALFTIEEIKEMEDYPSMILEIVNSHRERMHIDFENLSYLVNHIDRVDETSVTSTEELAAAIFAPPKLSERTTDPTEEEKILFSEQYEKIYEKYFSENTGWERRYDLSIMIEEVWRKFRGIIISAIVLFVGILILNNISYKEEIHIASLKGIVVDSAIPTGSDEFTGNYASAYIDGYIKHYIFKDSSVYLEFRLPGYYLTGYTEDVPDVDYFTVIAAIPKNGDYRVYTPDIQCKNPNGYSITADMYTAFTDGELECIIISTKQNDLNKRSDFLFSTDEDFTNVFSIYENLKNKLF